MVPRFYLAVCICLITAVVAAAELPTFPTDGETTRLHLGPPGTRAIINVGSSPKNHAASDSTASRNRRVLIVFATPNGNSAEWTLGGLRIPGSDWHYDIQHVLAQVSALRDHDPTTQYSLAVVQPFNKSWPAWRKIEQGQPSKDPQIAAFVDDLMTKTNCDELILSGHSGGGSFITGFINAHEQLPKSLTRIIYLDANYSFDDSQGHGAKLAAWLSQDPACKLISIAYDDREVTLNGKKIVSETGGTYRATDRMATALQQHASRELNSTTNGSFITRSDSADQIRLVVRTNPENKIWHTRLVELNGLLYSLAAGSPIQKRAGDLGGWRAYSSYLRPPFPELPPDAADGTTLSHTAVQLTPSQRQLSLLSFNEADLRDTLLVQEFSAGMTSLWFNESQFVPVHISALGQSGAKHTAIIRVSADYLAIGSQTDTALTPMTPLRAESIAISRNCILPTRKLVNDIYAAASIKLEPIPLTLNRESVSTFVLHDALIDAQRQATPDPARNAAPSTQPDTSQPPPPLVAGHKKDIVITPRLFERKGKVAIYGWHQPDGRAIQPLYLGHAASYVDYSHGVRLISRKLIVNGTERDVYEILADPELAPLLSDEGPFVLPASGAYSQQ